MRDWDYVAALGAYLGMTDASRLATGTPDAGRMLNAIVGASSQLGSRLSPELAAYALEMLAATDFDRLSGPGGDRYGALSGDLYRRLAARPRAGASLPSFEAFDRHFREYLRRFAVSLRAVLHATGVRKEIVSLESPACAESIRELRELPCRACGALTAIEGHDQLSASLARHVQILLDRSEGDIPPERRTAILEILDHLTAYPEYYRQMDKSDKTKATQALTAAMSDLSRVGEEDARQADLMAALGILLFNVFPSPAIVRFLVRHRPCDGNRVLLYEYNAILALNNMRMGRRKLAADCCQRAYDAAPDDDLKAYARMLEGCIALEERDYRKAAAALEKAMDIAGRQGLRSIAGFYLGVVCYEAGAFGQALNCFRDARIGAENEADAMAASNNMGTCYMAMGDLARALRSFDETESSGNYSGRATVRFNRSVAAGNAGIVYMSMREPALAREQFRKALRIARETGNARGVADHLMNIGLACKAMGEYGLACHHFVSGMNYAYTIEYLEGVTYAREQIGQVLALQGKHDEEEGIYRDIMRKYPGIRKLLMRK